METAASFEARSAPSLYPTTGKEQRIHPGLESCRRRREASLEA